MLKEAGMARASAIDERTFEERVEDVRKAAASWREEEKANRSPLRKVENTIVDLASDWHVDGDDTAVAVLLSGRVPAQVKRRMDDLAQARAAGRELELALWHEVREELLSRE
jgi:hypothetical protein